MKTVFSSKEDLGGLHYTTKHTGKMEGMMSLSSSCTINPYCISRRNVEGSICKKCYSEVMHRRFNNEFAKCFIENGNILSSRVLEDEYLPHIHSRTFRFEAFGDIINVTHLMNFINIAKKNPKTRFALWTKNFIILRQVFSYNAFLKKPKNLVIVASSPMINTPIDIPEHCDKVFTVFTKDFVKEHSVHINCGDRKCILCDACYDSKTKIINELIK